MNEATENAIGEATTRLDRAATLRESAEEGRPGRPPLDGVLLHSLLVEEAKAWAYLATAAAVAGGQEAAPSLSEMMAGALEGMGLAVPGAEDVGVLGSEG